MKKTEFSFPKPRIIHVLPQSNFKMSSSILDERLAGRGSSLPFPDSPLAKIHTYSYFSHKKLCLLNPSCNVTPPCLFTCGFLMPKVCLFIQT